LYWILWPLIWVIVRVALIVLGLIIFVIILPFCIIPIRYSVKAVTGDGTFVLVRVSYLFKLIRLVFEYREGEATTILQIAWKKIDLSGRGAKPEEPGEIPKKAQRSIFSFGSKRRSKRRSKDLDDEMNQQSKQTAGFRNVIEKIKAVLTYPNRKIIIKLVKQALRRAGRVLWPRHLAIFGEVGFSDPMKTGLFLGAYEAIISAYRLRQKICITGDFMADTFTARLNVDARGHIRIARLSLPFIWLLLKKPIRSLIKDLRRKGDSK